MIELRNGNIFIVTAPRAFLMLDSSGEIILFQTVGYGVRNDYSLVANDNFVYIPSKYYLDIISTNGSQYSSVSPWGTLRFRSALLHSSGDLIAVGETGTHIRVVRTDSQGNIIWDKSYETYGPDLNQSVRIIEGYDQQLILLIHNIENYFLGGVIKLDFNDGTKLLP